MMEDLEKAAEEYVKSTLVGSEFIKKNAFKAGAKWCAEYIAKCMSIMINNNPEL